MNKWKMQVLVSEHKGSILPAFFATPSRKLIIGWLQTSSQVVPGWLEVATLDSNVCYCSLGVLGSFQRTGQLGVPSITLVNIVMELSVFKLAWLILDRWQCLKTAFWVWVYKSTPGTLCRSICAKFTITFLLFFSLESGVVYICLPHESTRKTRVELTVCEDS